MITSPRNRSVLPPALALLVGTNDWSVRAIESILDPAAYLTLRAPNAVHAVQLAQNASPDVVIVYGDLLDPGLDDACRAVARETVLSPTCPVIVIASNGGTRERRLSSSALASGTCFMSRWTPKPSDSSSPGSSARSASCTAPASAS